MEFLESKIAVVTGASSGIGKAISLSLARHGAKLCLVGRNLENLKEVARRVKGHGAVASTYQADLGIDLELFRLIERLEEDVQKIDVLIHSAGVIALGRIGEAPVDAFDWQYRINVRAPFIITQKLLPMLRSGKAQVVFVNSTAGLTARSGVGQYAATKHALKALADALREEENGAGLRILSIYLGRTATPMQEAVHQSEGRKYMPEILLQPEAIGRIVVDALCSERSTEITNIKVRPARNFSKIS